MTSGYVKYFLFYMRLTKYAPLFLFAMMLLFSACSTRKEISLFNAPTDVVTDTIKQVYVVNDQGIETFYKIKVGDLLAIRNVQNKEFGGTVSSNVVNNLPTIQNVLSYEVEADGQVNLPAIGKVQVAGLGRKEAKAKIEQLYKEKLLSDPIIELGIVNLRVTLLGEFNKQGNFLLERDHTTLIEIIGEAGGITKTADPKTLKIIRGDKAKPELIYVNLNDVNSLASRKLILQNGDLIVLQPTKSAAFSDRLQRTNAIVQPILVIVNLAALIITLSR